MTSRSPVLVHVTHVFTASPERVFDAWLRPEALSHWMFGPAVRDEHIVRLRLDPVVGGHFSFVVQRQQTQIDHVGEYLAIERPQRLSFTWGTGQAPGSQVTLALRAHDGASTTLELTHEVDPAWADQAGRIEQSWRAMLAALERHLGERELYAEVVAPGTLRFARWLPGPIERVWAYLTEPDRRALWLAGGPMVLQPGGRVELQFRHADLSSVVEPTPARYAHLEGGARLLAEVTVCDPPHRLAYTWTGEAGEPSEVSFELTPHGERVLLVLTHARLSGRDAMVSVAGGWHTHLDLLADRLNGRPPGSFWSAHAVLEAWYEQHLPTA